MSCHRTQTSCLTKKKNIIINIVLFEAKNDRRQSLAPLNKSACSERLRIEIPE